MPSNGKPEAARPYCSSIADMVGDWIRQGTEGFIATQKILLDLAAQQNALALTIIRERLGMFTPKISTKAVVDLAGKGVKNFLEAQHVLLDIITQQNAILKDGLKPAIAGTPVAGLAEVVHQGVDNCVTAQKQFLDFFEVETEGAVKDYEEGKRFDTARLSDVAREGMRDFLRCQKKFLDIVEEELVNKKEPAAEPVEGEAKRVDIFEIAKQSIDSFVKAQERLLDLASDQIDVNVKMAHELFNVDMQKPTTSLPDLVKKSVDSFVAAQKALVDVASKPRKPAAEEHAPEMAMGRA